MIWTEILSSAPRFSAVLMKYSQASCGRHRRDGVCNFVFHEERVQTVGAEDDAVSIAESGLGEIDLNDRILAERTRQNGTEFARHRFFLRNQAEFPLHFDVGVIGGEFLDLAVAHEIDAGVADMSDDELLCCGKYRRTGSFPCGAVRIRGRSYRCRDWLL